MAQYDEFRVVLTPALNRAGDWVAEVERCPVPNLKGRKGFVTPKITREQLNQLRSPNGWPDLAKLKRIGEAVWQSVMPDQVDAAFESCLRSLGGGQRRMRFVLVLQGQENETAAPDRVRLSELPIETLYREAHQFLATDLVTPVSRSLQLDPDREPSRVNLPLRVLAVVASPAGKPPADVDREVEAIEEAVAQLPQSGLAAPLVVDYARSGTRKEMIACLGQKNYHVLHFIGHGGFDVVGDDPTPRAHLCFVRPDGGLTDPVSADELTVLLRNTSIGLVVITSCSSAAPTPNEEPYAVGAFDGIAQRLVSGVTGVTAAVAMQFDLEPMAAVEFTRVLYQNLLRPELSLDEVITMVRKQLAGGVPRLGVGHRAWVTPVVYWRCRDRVFEIDATRAELDDDVLQPLRGIDIQLENYVRTLRDFDTEAAKQKPDVRDLLTDSAFRRDLIAEVNRLHDEKQKLLGESVRLRGGRTGAGHEIECRLTIRLVAPGTVNMVQLQVAYPDGKLTFLPAVKADVAAEAETTQPGPGQIQVRLNSPSGRTSWEPGEYELAVLRFSVAHGVEPSLLDVHIRTAVVTRDEDLIPFRTVDGIVFVEGESTPPPRPTADSPGVKEAPEPEAIAASSPASAAPSPASAAPRVKWTKELGGWVCGAIAVHEDRLVVACLDGTVAVAVLRTADGEAVWRAPVNVGAALHAGPLLLAQDGPACAYVGAADGRVHAIDLVSRRDRVIVEAASAIEGSPVAAAARVCALSADGRVHSVDPRTGRRKVLFQMSAAAKGALSAASGIIFATDADGRVYAINATDGLLKWPLLTDEPLLSEGVVLAAPLPAGKWLYVCGTDGVLREIDIKNGGQRATHKLGAPVHVGPVRDGNRLYVGSSDGVVHAYHIGSRGLERLEPAWRPEADEEIAGLAASGGRVYVATGNRLVEVDSATGHNRELLRMSCLIGAPPVISGDRCYVAGLGGIVACLALSLGMPIASPTTPETISTPGRETRR